MAEGRGGREARVAIYEPGGPVLDLAHDRSLRAEVERHLLAAIRTGGLRPGDRILDGEIARALGVSPTPVREAILRLAHAGVIEHRPRRGFFLADAGHQSMDDVYRYRALLEGFAARLAAERIRHAQAVELQRLVGAGGDAERRGDSLAGVEYNAQLHALIVEAAQHPLLTRTWQMLAPLQWLPRDFSAAAGPPPPRAAADWTRRHQRLVDAVLSGDPDQAEAEAHDHVMRAGHVGQGAPSSPGKGWRPAPKAQTDQTR